MILQALADYYQRLLDDPSTDIAPHGWFQGRLDFVVKLNGDGEFVGLQNLKRKEGKKVFGRPTLLPCIGKQASKHANSGKDANLLWDNSSFIFGVGNKGDLKLTSFISMTKDCVGDLNDEAVNALLKYLEAGKEDASLFSPVLEHPEFGKEISTGRANISFSLEGDSNPFVFARPKIKERVSCLELTDGAPVGTCLISGKPNQSIELCHPVIKGVRKSNPTDPDPNYISFNEQAFISFGKKQSANAPSSKKSVFAYTTALNHLLAKGSSQRMQVGDASTVFWAKNPCDFESDFLDYLSPNTGEEAVSYDKIRGLLSAVRTGIPSEEEELPFYVLGLAPNASRISIRFWHDGNVKELKERVAEHFQDLEIVHSEKQKAYISLRRILLSTTRSSPSHPFGSDDEIIPNLASEMMRSILSGSLYPQTLLLSVIRRIKAEQANKNKEGKPVQNVTYVRAAIIKAVLNRKYKTEELKVNLDLENMSKGYRLGRLFAVLEKIQWLALNDLNANLRDKFYSSASCTPNRVFPHLMDLSNKHLKKIRSGNPGSARNREKEIHEILTADFFSEGFPKILSLDDQGRFSVGYYQQKFYVKETEDKGEEV